MLSFAGCFQALVAGGRRSPARPARSSEAYLVRFWLGGRWRDVPRVQLRMRRSVYCMDVWMGYQGSSRGALAQKSPAACGTRAGNS